MKGKMTYVAAMMRDARTQIRRRVVRAGRAALRGRIDTMRRMPGQGTTEYAILVGVLVVIAILAITVIAPKVQELWDAVAAGLNAL